MLLAEEFGVAEIFEHIPDARIECEPTVANPADHALLLVETDDSDHEEIEAALECDPAIAMVEDFGDQARGRRYRVTWGGRAWEVLQRLASADVTVLNLLGERKHWAFRVMTLDRAVIGKVDEELQELGCTPSYETITPLDGNSLKYASLSDTHYKTLVTAFEMGYYDIPRSITMGELAEIFSVSHQALSKRFRRAHKQLVGTEVIDT